MATWLLTALFHMIAWSIILVAWAIVSGAGNSGVKRYVGTVNFVKNVTCYGGYGLLWLLNALSTWILPASEIDTGYSETKGASGFGAVFFYTLFAGANIFVTIWFFPELEKWAKRA